MTPQRREFWSYFEKYIVRDDEASGSRPSGNYLENFKALFSVDQVDLGLNVYLTWDLRLQPSGTEIAYVRAVLRSHYE